MQEYGDFSPASEAYLTAITEYLDQRLDDSTLCPEHLLWSLIRFSFLYPISSTCIGFWVIVVRMIIPWKRLEMAHRQAVEALLWASLELLETMDSLKIPDMTLVSTARQVCVRQFPKSSFVSFYGSPYRLKLHLLSSHSI